MLAVLIIPVIFYLGLYRTIYFIHSIVLQILIPEVTESLPSKEHMDSEMTHGGSSVSINLPDPQPLVEDAKRSMETKTQEDIRDPISINPPDPRTLVEGAMKSMEIGALKDIPTPIKEKSNHDERTLRRTKRFHRCPKPDPVNGSVNINLSSTDYKPLHLDLQSNKHIMILSDPLKGASSSLVKYRWDTAGRSMAPESIVLLSLMRKAFGSAANAVFCNFSTFPVSRPRLSLPNVNNISTSAVVIYRKPSMQHKVLPSAISKALSVSLQGLLRESTFHSVSNPLQSLGHVVALPVPTSVVRRDLSTRNIVLSRAMSRAIDTILEGFSRGSISCPAIQDSRRTSSACKIQSTMSIDGRECIVHLEPSEWKIVEGMLNTISQERLVISTSNVQKRLGNISGRISPPLGLEPWYSASKFEASKFIVSPIILSDVLFPRSSMPTTSSFVPVLASEYLGNVDNGTPLSSKLALQPAAQMCLTPPVTFAGRETPVPSILTTARLVSIPRTSALQRKVLKNTIPKIGPSNMNILKPLVLTTSPSVSTLRILALQNKVLKTPTPKSDPFNMNVMEPLVLATSRSVLPVVSKLLDDVIKQVAPLLGLEPAGVTHPKALRCVGSPITLSPGDVPATFPSTTASFLRAAAHTTREKPSKNLAALHAIQKTLALHLQKHKEIKASANKATSCVRKFWIHDVKYRRCLKAKKQAEKALQKSSDKTKSLRKKEAEIKSRMSF